MQPITMISGAPGAGKTLHGIWLLEKCRKEENLQCYQYGVNELDESIAERLDDLQRWHELPAGSVLLIDEAQEDDRFPKRSPHQKPPPWIERITKVRHFGIRIILTTQDVRNIDPFVRRLVGVHYHVTNKTGGNVAIVHEFRPYADDPKSSAAQKTAQHKVWPYPKKLFDVYKSSTKHIVKRKIPRKFYMIPVLLVGTLYLGWSAVKQIAQLGKSNEREPVAAVTAEQGTGQPFGIAMGSSGDRGKWTTAEEFARLHTPVVPGVPWSAPIYADRQVTTTPDMHCIIVGDLNKWSADCRCYTEQMTPLQVERSLCRTAARGGVYNPYRAPMASTGQGRREQGGWSAATPPATPADTLTRAPVSSTRAAAAPPPVPPFTGVR